MSLSCSIDGDLDGSEWYWFWPDDFEALSTKRGRTCCSCGEKLKPGDEVMKFRRARAPSERCNYIEESIYGDEVPLAPWFMCETCGGLALSLRDLDFCFDIGESIKQQIADYRAEEKIWKEKSAALGVSNQTEA